MPHRLLLISAGLMGTVLLSVDTVLAVLRRPGIPIQIHDDLVGLVFLMACASSHALGYRRGLELGQRMERTAPRQVDEAVVLPIQRRGDAALN